jgi:hypothetical protein
LQEQEDWAREWAAVEERFSKLRRGCAICWLIGQELWTKEEEQWKRHRAMQCTAWERASRAEADEFRRKIVDRTVKNNC